MRFDSLDEFLRYFYENNVEIADVEFQIQRNEAPEDAAAPDVIEEIPPQDEPLPDENGNIKETITLVLPSGTCQRELVDGFLVVEECGMVPNACGTGYIVFEGSKLFLNMCDNDGTTIAYLRTAEGGTDTHVKVRQA